MDWLSVSFLSLNCQGLRSADLTDHRGTSDLLLLLVVRNFARAFSQD